MFKKVALKLLVFTLLLLGAFWAAATLIVPGLIRDQAKTFGEQIGYRIEIGDIDLSTE